MAGTRQVSQKMVALLVSQGKYEDAAELVSGSGDAFAMHSRQIKETVARAQEDQTRVLFTDLLFPVLETAKQEIREHRQWQEEVLAKLPDGSAAASLRAAFEDAARARAQLLDEVVATDEKYLDVQG